MQVRHILLEKPNDTVFTVPQSATLGEVVDILSKNRIGVVVVCDDPSKVDGIISERDVVRELGRRGVEVLTDRASAVMTRDPVCCGMNSRALEVLSMMDRGNFRHMPVVDEGRLVAVISIRDVVKARLKELASEAEALTGMIMGV